jgi:hypothetical protein
MTTNPVWPKNCGGLYTSQPTWRKALAGTGSGCGAQRAPPARVTSSTSGDVALHALASQPTCGLEEEVPPVLRGIAPAGSGHLRARFCSDAR